MARTVALSKSASVVLDSSGTGTAELGPSVPGEVWTPTNASVKCSTSTSEATCKIYAGNSLSPGSFVDGTTWGSTGDSTSNFGLSLYPGQQVFAQWAGGDAGATGTIVVTGTRSVP
jgi:hypothetical protein